MKPMEWKVETLWTGGRILTAECHLTMKKYAAWPSGKAECISLFDSATNIQPLWLGPGTIETAKRRCEEHRAKMMEEPDGN